jgi:hypothetical protein
VLALDDDSVFRLKVMLSSSFVLFVFIENIPYFERTEQRLKKKNKFKKLQTLNSIERTGLD